ncbi:MAG TPA: polysaccharide deacetylase family protein [Candidatus Acidoferrales bacterium]|nr:polysaccharide deacetylase family protein [Candidatus Acidoferrales bacterium]
MSHRTILGNARQALLSRVARREAVLQTDVPLITFSFDDFPRTALKTGGVILEDVGIRGTYYAAAGLMGTTSEVGPIFIEEDLHVLTEQGHELGSHTYSHVPARTTPLSRYRDEVTKGYRAFEENLGLPATRNFSYPFGEVTLRVKREVAPSMMSCRGIIGGLNGPLVDLNLLRATSLYGGIEQLAGAGSLINRNAEQRAWLIFYTHDVQANPTPYGCTPQLLEQVVCAALRSGARIGTVGEVLTLSRIINS